MSFLSTILSRLRGAGRSPARLYVADAAQLAGSGGPGRLSPREQIHILQQLSRFAAKEGMAVQAVFDGRPLREVDHGGEFNGIRVFFTEKGHDVPDLVVDLVRSGQRRSRVTVITANTELEKRVTGMGATTMRPSTLKKAMGGGGESGGGSGRGGGGERGSSSRRRRSRPRRRPRQEASREKSEAQGGATRDGVRDLIDLVE